MKKVLSLLLLSLSINSLFTIILEMRGVMQNLSHHMKKIQVKKIKATVLQCITTVIRVIKSISYKSLNKR